MKSMRSPDATNLSLDHCTLSKAFCMLLDLQWKFQRLLKRRDERAEEEGPAKTSSSSRVVVMHPALRKILNPPTQIHQALNSLKGVLLISGLRIQSGRLRHLSRVHPFQVRPAILEAQYRCCPQVEEAKDPPCEKREVEVTIAVSEPRKSY